LLGGTLSKIGNELFNLQRNEFGEIEEGFTDGKLGSSTMPHKRNPTSAENLAGLARPLRYNAALMVEGLVSESERDGIAWKMEWKALPECCLIAGAMLFQAKQPVGRPEGQCRGDGGQPRQDARLPAERTRDARTVANASASRPRTNGSTKRRCMASRSKLELCRGDATARAVSGLLGDDEIVDFTDPLQYLGQCGATVDRVVATHQDWLAA
jgi:adenylosuccinate lyase